MDKNEIIIHVANDILNSLNIGQIVNVLRNHSVSQAHEYYDNLSDGEREDVENRITEAKEKAEEAAKAKEEKAEDLEVVS